MMVTIVPLQYSLGEYHFEWKQMQRKQQKGSESVQLVGIVNHDRNTCILINTKWMNCLLAISTGIPSLHGYDTVSRYRHFSIYIENFSHDTVNVVKYSMNECKQEHS